MALEAINPFRGEQYYDDSKICLPRLPDDILLFVFDAIRFQDLFASVRVSRRFKRLSEYVRHSLIQKYFEATHKMPSHFAFHAMHVSDIKRANEKACQNHPLKVKETLDWHEDPPTHLFDLDGFCDFIYSEDQCKIDIINRKTGARTKIDLRNFISTPNLLSYVCVVQHVVYFQNDLLIIDRMNIKMNHQLIALRWSRSQQRWVKVFQILECKKYFVEGNQFVYTVQKNPFYGGIRNRLLAYIEKKCASNHDQTNPILSSLLTVFSISESSDLIVRNLDTLEEVNVSQRLGNDKWVMGFNGKSLFYLGPDFEPELNFHDFHVRGHTLTLEQVVKGSVEFAESWTVNLSSLLKIDLLLGERYSISITANSRSFGVDGEGFSLDRVYDHQVGGYIELPFLKGFGFRSLNWNEKYWIAQTARPLAFRLFDKETQVQVFPCENNAASMELSLGAAGFNETLQFDFPYRWLILKTNPHKIVIWDLKEQKPLRTIMTRRYTIIKFKYHDHTLIIIGRDLTPVNHHQLVFRTFMYNFEEAEIVHPTPTLAKPPADVKRLKRG